MHLFIEAKDKKFIFIVPVRYLIKHISFFLLLAMPQFGFSQIDTAKTQSAPITIKDTGSKQHQSTKGRVFISYGLGQSTILWRIYGSFILGYDPHGLSQSIVRGGTIDYGIKKNITIGLGIAYQTTTGIPQGNAYNTGGGVENTTRLNLTARILLYIICTRNIELYYGLRLGISHWTDEVAPATWGQLINGPALGYGDVIYPSFQVPAGVRILVGPIGIHFEVAIGTPYFAEGGITVRI